jgi:hypothetical protein
MTKNYHIVAYCIHLANLRERLEFAALRAPVAIASRMHILRARIGLHMQAAQGDRFAFDTEAVNEAQELLA